jgi:hypothetical protein
VEYFGPKTDQLDWYFENGKVTFTSYTEKIQAGRGTSLGTTFDSSKLTALRNSQAAHAHFCRRREERFQ